MQFAKFIKISLAFLFLTGCYSLFAQDEPQEDRTQDEYNYQVFEVDGEYIGQIEMDAIEINGKKPSKSRIKKGKRRLQKYSRLKWHVHKVYPYAVKVGKLLEEVNAEITALPEGEKKNQYIKEKEKSLFGKYEDDIRKMTRSQGKLLIKLVYRETGNSMYFLIKDLKSGATALLWQSIGRVFGINLKEEYAADADENFMIERIVKDLEQGGYNMVYKCHNYALQ